jgi:hypothetical protein
MNPEQFNTLIDAISSVGQANTWAILSAIAAIATAIFTVLYVIFTVGIFWTTSRSTVLLRKSILQQRIIDVSRQWNSMEFVEARNRGSGILAKAKEQNALGSVYSSLMDVPEPCLGPNLGHRSLLCELAYAGCHETGRFRPSGCRVQRPNHPLVPRPEGGFRYLRRRRKEGLQRTAKSP